MNVNRSFWREKRVFVTGHTGFKGSWLALWLNQLGADVTGYALDPPTSPSLFVQANVGSKLHSIRGDIRDFSQLKSAIEESKPEIVLHLAAQTVVKRGYEDPIENYSSNVMGTVHLFEAIRQLKRPCIIVNVTSDKCYENREWLWGYREIDRMGGHDPYSNSKGCAELVTHSYRESFFAAANHSQHGVALGSARAGNAIGGGDWTADQLIPDLMRAFQSKKPCLIRNPLAYRPWQFVLEPLRGYLMLAERLSADPVQFSTGWNFGPADRDARPVSWIAERLIKNWGDGASWEQDAASHSHEAHALKLDTSKAGAGLRWQPVLPLESALNWIVAWYKAYQANEDLRKITLCQIDEYESLASGLD